jgi:hypothetical protein
MSRLVDPWRKLSVRLRGLQSLGASCFEISHLLTGHQVLSLSMPDNWVSRNSFARYEEFPLSPFATFDEDSPIQKFTIRLA